MWKGNIYKNPVFKSHPQLEKVSGYGENLRIWRLSPYLAISAISGSENSFKNNFLAAVYGRNRHIRRCLSSSDFDRDILYRFLLELCHPFSLLFPVQSITYPVLLDVFFHAESKYLGFRIRKLAVFFGNPFKICAVDLAV